MCISENEYHKDVCLKEVGLHAHNLLTIVGSIINIRGGGGGPMWPSYPHCQWTLIIHDNSRLALNFSGIDPGFSRYICGHTEISTS